MNENYVNLAKEARSRNDFELEQEYLEKAYEVNSSNVKVINALIRNAKKRHDNSSVVSWLEILYEIKPSGEILFQLIQIAKSEGNKEREKELIKMKKVIEPNNHKVNKTLTREKKKEVKEVLPYINLSEEDYKLVQQVRKIIYDDFELKYKVDVIHELLSGNEEVMFCLLVELYKSELFLQFAKKLVKESKKELTEETPIAKRRMVNKMYQFAVSRKTMKGDWDLFWFDCKRDTLELKKIKHLN